MRTMTATLLSTLSLLAISHASAEAVTSDTRVQMDDTLIVTGTRRSDRTAYSSAVPIDVIAQETLQTSASDELMDKLAQSIPSFNVQRLPMSDGLVFVRPATLRGLSPDQTLLLINGKRRHRSALLGSRGAQGADLAQLPSLAIKRLEVLRDGASAQYGSDAIAGVINIILDDESGVTGFGQLSQYYEGDGFNRQLGLKAGLRSARAFLTLTAEYARAERTSRSMQRADAIAFEAATGIDVRDPVQDWGQPDRETFRLAANAGLDMNEAIEAYIFGTYGQANGASDFNWRNPANTAGYTETTAFPGWTLSYLFPAGFSPQFGQDDEDYQANAGLKGTTAGSLDWDLGLSFGRNKIAYKMTDTVNTSFGPESPTTFKPGSLVQEEFNLNLDFIYTLDIGVPARPVNIAFGFERREETYKIRAGDRYSWDVGPGASVGLPSGSNGFPGYSPQQAGSWSQESYAGYLDIDAQLTSAWSLNVAVRAEDYAGFGSTFDTKIASRYEMVRGLALRAAYSTGFRAPTPGQSNYTRTAQGLDTNTLQVYTTGLISPSNPIARYFGAVALEPEESRNLSIGLVAQPLPHLSASIDYYRINVSDRFGQSGNFTLTNAQRAELMAAGISGAESYATISYFTNAFDTRTQGLDVVLSYRANIGDNSALQFTGAYNWNTTKVIRADSTIINDLARINIERRLPRHNATLSANYSHGLFNLGARMRYFGEWTDAQSQSSSDLIQTFGAEVLFDISAIYTLRDTIKITLGAENLFDSYPDRALYQAVRGLIYSRNSPYDSDGGRYYLRVSFRY